ncbi:Nucleic acid-binding proteins protein [Dioscorea alata]|uniref:Nucleic acid-binding proteins protein n=1 Tax=Dioscorea alata TaxID=55571 RepID=A0ACB7UU14_DIOAL|nr:Nucleic acid-binding proteins protein [Dioscorea alata]
MLAAHGALSIVSQPFAVDGTSSPSIPASMAYCWFLKPRRRPFFSRISRIAILGSQSGGSSSRSVSQEEFVLEDSKAGNGDAREVRRSADWKEARTYKESGVIFDGKIEGFNSGGLLIRFYSLLGFLPFPLLSPSHFWKDSNKTVQEIARNLVGSSIAVKVIQASEEEKRLIFSERDADWSKYSEQVKVGDIFSGRVGSIEDYGAFVHLLFPDGFYHLTGLVHISEVSWDLVQDVRDFLSEGDLVKVKVIHIDRERSRITLSIKQLEDDPLLETLDKVIPPQGQLESDSLSASSPSNMEPLPGLESICQELLQEEGVTDVSFGRQALEKRVVSQDLELWLSNVPAKGNQFTLLARAGRQVQEVYLTTTLDQEGIKKAVQRVLGRVP